MEVTEATDSGLWEEGMVKERTMERGREPLRSSAAGCKRKELIKSLKVTACLEVTVLLLRSCCFFLYAREGPSLIRWDNFIITP